MNWEQLLSLKRYGDTQKRERIKQDETRLGFEVDFDRIIFSSAFRSLQDKTQVIPLSKTDFVHTRLTHSLEVSVVGRTLGRRVGKILLERHPNLKELGYTFNDFGAIVAAASVMHDIGNPPFGHSGEKAIGEYFKTGKGLQYKEQLTEKEYQDIIDFEGNANGFKILTESNQGTEGGLRLSYATLGAFMKYPKESLPKKPTKHIVDKKYGFFQSEKEAFLDIANDLGLKKKESDGISYYRHPLAYLVEAADDICYTIIDFEDGINLGLIDEDYALEYMVKLVKDTIDIKKYNSLQYKKDRVSYLRALAIGVLINEAIDIFLENEEEILNGTFDKSLLDKCKFEAQINDIIKISVEKIYRSKEVIEKEVAGYKIIADLLDVFVTALNNKFKGNQSNYDKLVLNLLPKQYQQEKENLYDRIMQIASYVSGLSDGFAIRLYQKIKGNVV
ncbi:MULTISPECIES: deoxyguanosinetriphosphate triphosphohydrolase [unclassified Tenacibaculum]|uniref:deoxyguanosinetriphosphate triphosphohydrolase n=1 Tax=unclassified Tenacibaculum TaxID=2635139 RepID=UPI001F3DF0A0|nr:MULTISPECIES: deoxyguanosinetriphosphate triphosphohydrolase [unclassified Tenacibaculum]MCF2874883.1 deoxyguanosinetriphosphate triphosphohydrolase [Tenacibaculum sp. Cn5-1]MCF2934051.1 deoxyguanosinetriphosphate triphosphohydrolase [Tenacibaculum sp. Cn5-34]MCG7510261.1 deoxyguanosinetriphosphate triphosphohydrolase [Tenacibaculum sp. Cn5-46]